MGNRNVNGAICNNAGNLPPGAMPIILGQGGVGPGVGGCGLGSQFSPPPYGASCIGAQFPGNQFTGGLPLGLPPQFGPGGPFLGSSDACSLDTCGFAPIPHPPPPCYPMPPPPPSCCPMPLPPPPPCCIPQPQPCPIPVPVNSSKNNGFKKD